MPLESVSVVFEIEEKGSENFRLLASIKEYKFAFGRYWPLHSFGLFCTEDMMRGTGESLIGHTLRKFFVLTALEFWYMSPFEPREGLSSRCGNG